MNQLAGVDIELRRSMWDFLTEMNEKGTSIILTTHYLEEAEVLCRRALPLLTVVSLKRYQHERLLKPIK